MKTAIFTIIQHEPLFLPIWYEHYRKHFPPEAIHVLHHVLPPPRSEAQGLRKREWERTLDEHSSAHGYRRHDLVHDLSFDHDWLLRTVSGFQATLLRENDAVVFAEVDEIIALDPRADRHGGSLQAYMEETLSSSFVRVTNGYDVVHRHEDEPPLDFATRPILAQRRWWSWSRYYTKPLIATRPLSWSYGFHACGEVPDPVREKDDSLLLIHLHKVDFPACVRRNAANNDRPLRNDGMGIQNLIDEQQLREWWYSDPLEEIPGEVRGLV